jgi:trimeric autotransporter adhesin
MDSFLANLGSPPYIQPTRQTSGSGKQCLIKRDRDGSMRLPIYLASALTLLIGSAATAQTPVLPAAPQVTVGADLKQLIFDWSPVPLATRYQVLVNADGHSGFVPLGSPLPATQTRATIAIAVHLQRWANALYMVSACNAAGCRDSAAIFPRDQMLDTIGYLKASNSDPADQFGGAVVLSNDGSTLAVTSTNESSAASGINGDQSDNSARNSGAVFVFRRISGRWRQEAYIKGPPISTYFGTAGSQYQETLSLNNDGSLLAIGEPYHSAGAFGFSGEVYIYRRASSGSWSLSSTLRPPELESLSMFGHSLDLSLDGLTLRVTAMLPRTT